jgi:sialic acid synthase SpsE
MGQREYMNIGNAKKSYNMKIIFIFGQVNHHKQLSSCKTAIEVQNCAKHMDAKLQNYCQAHSMSSCTMNTPISTLLLHLNSNHDTAKPPTWRNSG